MNQFTRKAIVTGLMLAGAQIATAGTDVFFNPLVQGAAVAQVPDHINELNNPWQMPDGVTVRNLTSLKEIEADPSQSTIRVPGLRGGASMTDMAAFDPSGRYLFLPHETMHGAGVTRYDTVTDRATNLFRGSAIGVAGDHASWVADFGAFDPATWTPMNTLLLGEEWSGEGRLFELKNPMVDVNAGETAVVVELNSIPNVSHEGLRFNHAGTALYFVDEDKSGSIYKFVPTVKGDYSKGQSFVLSVTAFAGDVSKHWNDAVNVAQPRTGLASWVALTDASGVALTPTDPFLNGPSRSSNPAVIRGGRAAADEVNATPFGRPEDVEVGYLGNGDEVLYFNATSERSIYSVEELGKGQVMVRLMARGAPKHGPACSAANPCTPLNLGYDNDSGVLHDIDNIAQDALGNIYVVEDWPNHSNTGGDIWFVRDTNNDGVAESLDRFLSLQVKGAENTGMIFRPQHPTQFIVNVQHPESVTAVNGQGDATWLFDIKDVVAPPCVGPEREHVKVRTCNDENDANFVRKLMKVAHKGGKHARRVRRHQKDD